MKRWTMTTAARGFTLIELMLVVCIIGLLSMIAIPEFQRSNLRSKAAERRTIMEAVGRAVGDRIMNAGEVSAGALGRKVLQGLANPPGALTTAKRPFDWTMAGWNQIPMVVEGGSYYSYTFYAVDEDGTGKTVTMTVGASGDLDGDGVSSDKVMNYVAVGYAFQPDPTTPEDPAAGMEDDLGPTHTF